MDTFYGETRTTRAANMKVERRREQGRPRRKWMGCVREDLEEKQLIMEDAADRLRWNANDHKRRPCLKWEKPEKEEQKRT